MNDDQLTLMVQHKTMLHPVTIMRGSNHAELARVANFLAERGFDIHMYNHTRSCMCGEDDCPCPVPNVIGTPEEIAELKEAIRECVPRITEPEIKIFCPCCKRNMSAMEEEERTRHMWEIHNIIMEAGYICSWCYKSFKDEAEAKEHARSHVR